MLGLIAMTMNSRTMDTYLEDFSSLYRQDRLKSEVIGPDDTEEKIRAMRMILEPYSRSASALVRVQGGLPARSEGTLSRRLLAQHAGQRARKQDAGNAAGAYGICHCCRHR